MTFPFGPLETGSGGRGGDSLRSAMVAFAGLDSASESLEESEEESSEAVVFLGASDNVALVSEPTTGFFFASSSEDSLSELEEESESDSGKGTF